MIGARLIRSPALWLSASVLAFFCLALGLALENYYSVANIHIDLPILVQAISSTAHGRPLYDQFDCADTGRCSLLLVHPSLALYLAVPFYELAPTPITLLVLQTAAVALAAVPLYLIARRVGLSPPLSWAVCVVYLVYVPVVSSIIIAVNIEPFLPVELFALFWLWQTRRFLWGLAVAALASLTLEVAPVLIFFFGVFFVLPSLLGFARGIRSRLRTRTGTRGLRRVLSWAGNLLYRSDGAAAMGLMVFAVAAYFSLRLFVEHGYLFGLPRLPPGYSVSANIANPYFSPTLGALKTDLVHKLEYWALAFGLLGFVGLLVPRTLVLAVPWAAYTLLTYAPDYTTFGQHYGIVAAIPLMISFAYGLKRLTATTSSSRSSRLTRSRKRWVSWLVPLLVAIVAVNLVVGPASPVATHLVGGNLLFSKQYPVDWNRTPGFAAIQSLCSRVPWNATVATPTALWLFVANDPNSYTYPFYPHESSLPFNTSTPQYVLVAGWHHKFPSGGLPDVDAADYSLVGTAPYTSVGAVALYERR